ncbi:MAG TPA: mannose-1-phosphate guanylyltransferase [Candidatus Acidoferrum sp.]|nr:mannose-1-phosphate guanylyltransferase [Candidatus Acidoferrum sp.]
MFDDSSVSAKSKKLVACAVLLAGGRGTRFWPRSRMRTPKQLLNIVGDESMLRMTMQRLLGVFAARNFWAVTNEEQAAGVRHELPGVPASHVLTEPVGRNTAAAIGLAAIHLAHAHGDALMGVVPSDSYVADAAGYRKVIRAALEVARTPGRLVVLGIPPTRPETGYGYIEKANDSMRANGMAAYQVVRFTEKPDLATAKRYAACGKYFWNAGMFFWRASTFLENLQRFLPETHDALHELGKKIGTRQYASALRRIYPELENISVDYAVMEPVTRLHALPASPVKQEARAPTVFVIPANVGWSDIGSWAAVYELLAGKPGVNVAAGPSFTLDATGNYLWSGKKFVAAIGVRDLVVVETDDALLICARERSQDVGKVVKWLEEQKKTRLI